jgi:hypothetical protein
VRKRFQLRPGVTAVEVVIVLGLFSIMTTGLMTLFSMGLKQYQTGAGKGDADTQASLISQSMVIDIENGKSAANVNSGLEVQMPGVNDQGDWDRSVSGDLVRYYASGGTLYRRVNGGLIATVTNGVQSFTYNIVGGNVTFTLTLSRQNGMKTSVTGFTQRVLLRNYVAS